MIKILYRVVVLGSLLLGLLLAILFFYTTGSLDDLTRWHASPTQVVQQFNPDITQIPQTTSPVTPDTQPSSALFRDLLNNVNNLRQSQGLSTLTVDSRLNRAAAVQAQYNADNHDVTHEGEFGGDVANRVDAQDYLWATVGENLLANWNIDGDNVYQIWVDSPSHYNNLINPDYTDIGMAYVVTPIGQVYHAMVLARPR